MATSTEGAASAPTDTRGRPRPADEGGRMTHRQILEALSGMLLAMFTAFLSSTIVSNALPTIITSLHGTQSQYTWVVTATLLASTASTPIWGKLADLFSKKLLVQLAIVIFTIGSVLAGSAQSVGTLIGWRALQGLGLGGLQALVIIAIAAMISPRERGRYSGPIAAVMSVATVAGPLIGGVIVDTDWLGWRWCFFVCVPLAVISLLVVQRTLHLPVTKRKVSIDYLGAALIAAGVCDLLIWVTLAGNDFAWGSETSWLLAGIGVLLLVVAVFVEARAKEPIIPLRLFRDRTTALATIASVAVGVAMFGGAVFLGQYFQIARGYSPTASGLLTLPMIIGSMVSSTVSGALITRLGRWKAFLVAGAILMPVGFGLLATIDHGTDMVLLGVFLFVLGVGMGMTMQNLVLAVQNTVAATDLGAASSTVSFFRSLGGTVGVSVLGAVLASRVTDLTARGLAAAGVRVPSGSATGEVGIGSLNQLPPAVATIVRSAYGDATARIFLVAGALSIVTLVAILFIKEVPLRTQSGLERQQAPAQPEPAVRRAPGLHARATDAGRAPAHRAVAGGTTASEQTQRLSLPEPALVGTAAGAGGGAGNGQLGNGHARHALRTDDVPAAAAPPASGTAPGFGSEAGDRGTGPEHACRAIGADFASPEFAAGGPEIVGPASDGPEIVGPEIVGTVYRADGVGLAGAVVTVTDPAGRQGARTSTAPDGGYRLRVPHGGTFLVVAASRAFQPHAAMVAVADRPVRHDVTLTGASGVRGVVRTGDAAGGSRPVPGAAVTLIDVRGNVAAAAVADELGHYHITGVPDGQYTLTATAVGCQPAAVSLLLPDGEITERLLELPRRARLLGTVTAAGREGVTAAGRDGVTATGRDGVTATGRDGAAAVGRDRGVADAVVTLIDSGGRVVGSTLSDADGAFLFDDLAEGTYTLTARGYAPMATVVQVTAGGATTAQVAFPTPVVGPAGSGLPHGDAPAQPGASVPGVSLDTGGLR